MLASATFALISISGSSSDIAKDDPNISALATSAVVKFFIITDSLN
ncbi:MAG: hypothetical protein DHS20C09_13900 [marine bacterium B5-7]|nr:MAG: hypothetical protein DHS20C09_13900 [marine bacterium B5-7]